MDFQSLQIMPSIIKNLQEQDYAVPTPIQQQAIPQVLQKRDLFGCAQTGTGKTAAFAVPILQMLEQTRVQGRHIRALVLTPTRELAIQILDSFMAYGKGLHSHCCVIYGGVNQNSQVQSLRRGVDVLVATPGRLLDLVGQGFVDLSQVEIFVLDEADRMLDMGFIHDVKRVLAQLPAQRQNLMFSATLPREIRELVDGILQDPVKISVAPPATTVEKIDQSVYYVDKENKSKLLLWVLKDPRISSALVFTRTKHGADRVTRELIRAGVPAAAIHGNKSQNARQAALTQFKRHQIRVLVATDIAARGIDIDELSHVINYDIPEVPETYVHRIGRTARAGREGTAIAFCSIDEKADFQGVLRLIHKNVQEVKEHPYPMQQLTPMSKAEKAQKQLQRQQAAREARARRQGQPPAGNTQRRSRAQKPAAASTAHPAPQPKAAAKPNYPRVQAGKPQAPAGRHAAKGVKRGVRDGGSASSLRTDASKPRPDLQKYIPKPLRSRPTDQPLKKHL